ncbi:SAM-dependent methyltransferase [Sorangium cellulosum]|uniref:site-specific DNA-methyltransferase (adenine-specific) n=1 Tax=Sorangium cellulosum TaxID=56 RepID=A0A2L0FAL4_SORCE|nr:Eco57I restriction-modification methylase domain-containing protein [Sorangium cellulosum]AUX48561.1 SAM-dependent methyltransferase [Sorangium cellulosum]
MSAAIEVRRAPPSSLLGAVDLHRAEACRHLDPARRSALGQFLTPPPVASFMASLFQQLGPSVRLLDAGAGVGTLTAALVAEACSRPAPPAEIHAVGYELDPDFVKLLSESMAACRAACRPLGITFHGRAVQADFITHAVEELAGPGPHARFTHAILNPPYRKLGAGSAARRALRRAGIETTNLYTAFLALAVRALAPGGELCAITPRSFCSGPYFRPFRALFLREVSLRRVHVFESRTAAFADDGVLQENVVFCGVKGAAPGAVLVSSSDGPGDAPTAAREVPYEEVVRPGDPELFIRVVPDRAGQRAADVLAGLPARLADLGLSVSTGKVVDFRARGFLRADPGADTAPLIYPAHLDAGSVRWPKPGRKPNALVDCAATAKLWMPSGTYVVVKRFSSKEERRRITAAVLDPAAVPGARVGFENHLNVFHRGGGGLPPLLARGVCAFLSSTLVDTCFRQWSGHTQVNATDLRNLAYPAMTAIERLGACVPLGPASQREIDRAVEEVIGFSGRAATL